MNAPAVYSFRSPIEWELAMEEWCAENEPAYKLYDHDEATDTYTPVFKSRLDLFPKVQYGAHWGKRYYPPHYRPRGGCTDKLDGGSRADYRAAGIYRY